jgi:hypothetical protein
MVMLHVPVTGTGMEHIVKVMWFVRHTIGLNSKMLKNESGTT